MQFATKEISRFMSKPEEQDWRSAKRLARYLKDNWRVVIMYKYQKLGKVTAILHDVSARGEALLRESRCSEDIA